MDPIGANGASLSWPLMTATAAQPTSSSSNLQLFLAPRGSQLHRRDEGFILRPAPMWFNSALQPALEALKKSGCHIVLGPPGSGKSWLLDQLNAKISVAGTSVLSIKLGRITSDSDLRRQLFESDQYRRWLQGRDHLCILLDSIDEGVLEVGNIVGALQSGFEGVPTDRLHLVISCRTAVWPETLTGFLNNAWRKQEASHDEGEDASKAPRQASIHVWEIAPLCEEEIREAASARGLDPDAFTKQVVSRRVQSLAEVPLTLFMLLALFGGEGGLPERAVDLYERGIAKLCEPTMERRDQRHGGALTPQQRLEVLSAIAMMTLLTGHSALHVGQGDDERDGGVPLEMLLGLECGRDGAAVTIDVDVLADVQAHCPLDAYGPSLRALSSKAYADFLAARFLNRAGLSPSEIARLVSVPQGDGTRVAPQLHEVVAWLASMDDRIRSAILASEPEILLQSDVEAPGADFPEQLVNALLNRARGGALSYTDRRSFDALLSRLMHPRLAEQLKPVLLNAQEPDSVTEIAISIAERCNLTEAGDAIAAVALDPTRSPYIRTHAGYAVVRLDEERSCCAMKALLQPTTVDPDDNLRGLALHATWPRCLTAAELFEALTLPKRSTHGGAYSGFLTRDLASEVAEADLVPAIEWAAKVPVRDAGCWSCMERLAGKLLAKAFSLPSHTEIDAAFARAAIGRARKHNPAFYIEKPDADAWSKGNDVAGVQKLIESSPERRRSVVIHMVEAATEELDLVHVVHGPTSWVLEADFEWILNRAVEHEESGDADLAKRWASLADLLFRRACEACAGNLDAWLRCREQSSVVREVMPYRLVQPIGDPTRLPRMTDPEARKEKFRYLRERRFMERPRRSQPPLVPAGMLESWIGACETKSSLILESLFYNMSFERQREYIDCSRPRDATPGWEGLSEQNRQRVLDAAVRYVEENGNRVEEFVARYYGDGPRYVHDYTAIQAIHLLLRHRPYALDALPDDVLATWTPMILPMLTNNFRCEQSEQEQLLKMIARRAKAAADSTLLREVESRRENEQFGANLLHYYRKHGLIDAPLAQALLNSIETEQYAPGRLAEVVGAVCEVVLAQSVESVSRIVSGSVNDDTDRERISDCAAAAVLAAPQAFWPIVWPRVSHDVSTARRMLSHIAHAVDFEQGRDTLDGLSSSGTGEILHWLYEHYNPDSDREPNSGAARSATNDDSLRHMRNRLLNHLTADGSEDAVTSLRHLRERYPHHAWLHDGVLDAERAWRGRHGWRYPRTNFVGCTLRRGESQSQRCVRPRNALGV